MRSPPRGAHLAQRHAARTPALKRKWARLEGRHRLGQAGFFRAFVDGCGLHATVNLDRLAFIKG
ncbi:MAG TPA: hypothetical protein VKF35_07805, partial [Hyphomicrobiaceae bacterium]|nr:hypothetical protein [Hyphomicrobiaceae bacterium]